MHTDLSSHLHSEKCNNLIKLLQECHKEYPVRKFIGICNTIDTQMTKCLKEERLARRQRNFEKSKETHKRLRELAEEERQRSHINHKLKVLFTMCDNLNTSVETISITESIGNDKLNSKTLSISERYYEHKYCRKLPKISDDICQRVSFHSNRVCLISLAEDHPVMAKNIIKMNFKVSEKVDRLQNKVSGKECDDDTNYPVYSCIDGKLLEINEKLITDPNLLKIRPFTEGYIALLLPILSEFKESKSFMLTREQYESS